MTAKRQSTGVLGLDERLGGGLLPGALTVVVGATGIGKTQLGLQYAAASGETEPKRGLIFDVCARGDSQNHDDYAKRMFDWDLQVGQPHQRDRLDDFYAEASGLGDYLHVFDYTGRRVTKRDLDWDEWNEWQAQLNVRLHHAIAFLYGGFVSGARRVVVDGVEPSDRPNESIQLNMFEYVYHQIVRKDPLWVARDLFRERFRANSESAAAHNYDPATIGCLLLSTSHEVMLDDLISRRLDEGDALSNANTLIYMGKTREGNRVGRGMLVAKHRGSACSDEILPYEIDDHGVRLTEN
ncbi:MAG: ATPase domain-containing protein [Pirellulaceae bacterium]|jgi:hypothetical protein|nr:ATPase domain-containing protein [Pirellulaceae bacterium]MDP7015716.1 ATPase domain-containing protein [Pirellulaceae bacterium]